AHQAGVRRGMTVSQARATATPGETLRVLAESPADTAAAEAALADVGYAFAPRVEAEPGRIFLEVGDLRRMFPSERAVAQGLAAAALDEPVGPRLPADALEEGTELEYAVVELEPLSFLLRGLFDRALARLACRGLGCAGVTVRLKLEPRGYEVREVPLGAPTR